MHMDEKARNVSPGLGQFPNIKWGPGRVGRCGPKLVLSAHKSSRNPMVMVSRPMLAEDGPRGREIDATPKRRRTSLPTQTVGTTKCTCKPWRERKRQAPETAGFHLRRGVLFVPAHLADPPIPTRQQTTKPDPQADATSERAHTTSSSDIPQRTSRMQHAISLVATLIAWRALASELPRSARANFVGQR